MVNEDKFEELWAKAGAIEHASKLAAEYPAWRTKQRRRAGMVAGMALLLAVATPAVYTIQRTSSDSPLQVYCNRVDMSTQQWVDLADELLMTA